MSEIDAVELELFRYATSSVVDEIEVNLTRTAYSPLIYEYKDYCVGILTRDYRLVTQSRGSLPIFLGDLGAPVRDAVETLGVEEVRDGDVFITNYTAICGQHINNVVMGTPIFVAGELFGFVAIRAHWADLGGLVPGSMSWNAQDVHQEGIQFRGLVIAREGKVDRGALATIQANTRMPEYVTGDLFAQLGGCRRGVERWSERVTARWPLPAQRTLVEKQWDGSRAVARSAIAELPDGTYRASCHMDDSGTPGSEPMEMVVTVTVDGDQMLVDLSGMPPQVSGPINSGGMGGGVTGVRVAFKSLVAPQRPADEGLFDCLSVRLAEGTVVDAVGDAPMGHWNTAMPTLIDLTLRAIGDAIPELAPAGHHASMGLFQLSGKDSVGKWWQLIDTNVGGWGGNVDGDGFSPLKTMFHGDNRDIPVELIENRYPLRIDRYELVPDTGGPGKFRGGLATEKTFLVLGEVLLESGMERTSEPAWGLAGGMAGTPGDILVQQAEGEPWVSVKKGTDVRLAAGSRLKVRSGAGGGWGKPADREPALISRDVALGYVSERLEGVA